MMASVWMFTTDARANLTSCTNEDGAPGTGTTGAGGRGTATGSAAFTGGFSARAQPTSNRLTLSSRHILHPQVIEEVGEELLLLVAEVAARLVLQHPQDVDGLLGQRQVALAVGRLGMRD